MILEGDITGISLPNCYGNNPQCSHGDIRSGHFFPIVHTIFHLVSSVFPPAKMVFPLDFRLSREAHLRARLTAPSSSQTWVAYCCFAPTDRVYIDHHRPLLCVHPPVPVVACIAPPRWLIQHDTTMAKRPNVANIVSISFIHRGSLLIYHPSSDVYSTKW